jgi:steroid 5-alpha reductase family enzyme
VLDAGVQLASLAASLAVMLVAWGVSLRMRDASVADIAWGPALAAVAWGAVAAGAGGEASVLLAALITIWAVRLAVHIGARHDGEDRRYAAMRERHGEGVAARSLWSVFGLQAAVAWVVALPVQAAAADPAAALGGWAAAGVALCALGFACEAAADLQLTRFLRRPGSHEAVMDEGLWRYSRHPNYFGDSCFWWGVWLIALEADSAWWTLAGPLLMTILLLRVSGVALTERTIASRRPGYRDYVRRTSAFVPLPPRR